MFQIGLYIHCRMYPSNLVEQILPVHFAPKDLKENKIFKDTFEHIQESNLTLAHIVLKYLNLVVIIENMFNNAILKNTYLS